MKVLRAVMEVRSWVVVVGNGVRWRWEVGGGRVKRAAYGGVKAQRGM